MTQEEKGNTQKLRANGKFYVCSYEHKPCQDVHRVYVEDELMLSSNAMASVNQLVTIAVLFFDLL